MTENTEKKEAGKRVAMTDLELRLREKHKPLGKPTYSRDSARPWLQRPSDERIRASQTGESW